MPIPFTCPNCKKAYKLKDEVAGKRVTCSNCRQTSLVPVPKTAAATKKGPAKVLSAAEAEALAAAAFADETSAAPAPVEVEGAPIKVKCRYCDHENTFEARLAGKNAPCQNDDCRKIIKVPLLEKTGPKDWRDVGKQLPSLARRDQEQIEGAWGNVDTAAVSREALVGARATERDEEPEPPNWGKRLIYAAVALVVVGITVWGVLYGVRQYDDYRAGRAMQLALAFEYKDANSGAKKKLDKAPDAIVRMLAGMQEIDQGAKAKEAKAHLEEARSKLEPINSNERAVALVEVAALLAELTGSRAESDAQNRIEWDREKLGTAVRATVMKLPPGEGDDGRDMRAHACRVLTRRLVQRNHISGAIQISNAIAPPEEQAELMAIVGLELLRLGHRDKAEELAVKASAGGSNPSATSLIALWMALSGPDASEEKKKLAAEMIVKIAPVPGKKGALNPVARIGYAEGLARQGNLDGARELARRDGKPEELLRAGAALAAATRELADFEACAKHIEVEFKDRAPPPWLLLRLVEAALDAGHLDLAEKLANANKDAGLKSWSHYEIVRKKLQTSKSADFAWTEAAGDPDRLGRAMAIAAVARQKARSGSRGSVFKEINKWPDEKLKPFGFAGIALTNSEWR